MKIATICRTWLRNTFEGPERSPKTEGREIECGLKAADFSQPRPPTNLVLAFLFAQAIVVIAIFQFP